MTSTAAPTSAGPEARYCETGDAVLLSGLQALVRIPLEQHRIDSRAGRDVATLVSGYEGSPLAGFDLEMQRQEKLMSAAGVVLVPALNEELGANAVQGTQLASASDDCLHDGVVGIWYGKAPGLDRASDAIRHGNLGGSDPEGGVLLLVGDDATAKSSTVPSSSEMAMAELGMPVLVPATPREIVELGLHGIAMSRYSGLWSGLKLATPVVDGTATTSMHDNVITPVMPDPVPEEAVYRHEVSAHFLQPALTGLESSATGIRIELARRYARANALNRITGDPVARIGIIASGTTFLTIRRALEKLGLGDDLSTSGVRLLKLAMVSPMDTETLDEFAAGLDEIIVVEEKRAFVELLVKDHLYGRPDCPRIVGRRDTDGQPLFPTGGEVTIAVAQRIVARRLTQSRIAVGTAKSMGGAGRIALPLAVRTPFFCSGCPHNRSTEVPDGSLVGAGIGCSGLLTVMRPHRVGDVVGFTQMGGEGAQWVGMSRFVGRDHFIQNMGDGTFHHSGSLAIRNAIAAGVSITYKVLYNDVVAMTGGQRAVGKLSVAEIAREMLVEGAARVVVITDDTSKYRRKTLPRGIDVRHRDLLIAAQKELAAVRGVTVLIYDQECATELRRKRKRKLAVDPDTRVFINERVCEGCGDCGSRSNCLSVQPVDTDYGRKTAIHQSSCNKDYSCLDGECPSFITVRSAKKPVRRAELTPLEAADLAPVRRALDADECTVRMTGVGGTGIVTVAQILAVAGRYDGYHVQTLDQLGMAQKGGAVVSDIRLSRSVSQGTNRISNGDCTAYLGCDLLVAADPNNLGVASLRKTRGVISTSKVPTGAMVADPTSQFPAVDVLVGRIGEHIVDLVTFDAISSAVALFGNDQCANILVLGAAVQAGLIPVSVECVERAIAVNGIAVDINIQAFRRGRQAVSDRVSFDLVAGTELPQPSPTLLPGAAELAASLPTGTDREITELVAQRSSDLIAFQNRRWAQRYVADVAAVAEAESTQFGSAGELTRAAAHHLHKVMAYKDEYEVARLSIDPAVQKRIRSEFGPGAAISFRLHPPILRALGLKKKVSLGSWFIGVFRLLYAMRFLRGTPFDVFGYNDVRRTEREIIEEYRRDLLTALAELDEQTLPTLIELASAPDIIRGYEHIKMDNVARYREAIEELKRRLRC